MSGVKRLAANNALDNIPHMLRNLAAEIDAGNERPRTVILIGIVDADSPPDVFIFGQSLSRLEEAGALAACSQSLLQVTPA